MIYPVTLAQGPETGQVMVRFLDAPEAITIGKDPEEALRWARDALLVGRSGDMEAVARGRGG